MAYNFKAVWCKGASSNTLDALSRSLVKAPHPTELLAEYDEDSTPELSLLELRAANCEGLESIRLQDLRQWALQDEEYQYLRQTIVKGFQITKSGPELCKHYWQVRHHLTIDDDLIVHGCRLVIPSSMRRTTFSFTKGIRALYRQSKERTLHYTGKAQTMASKNMIIACKICQDHLPSQVKETIQQKPRPSYTYQEIAADFC